jgi:hypothetical protein
MALFEFVMNLNCISFVFPKQMKYQNINSVWCSVVSLVIPESVLCVSYTDNVHHR